MLLFPSDFKTNESFFVGPWKSWGSWPCACGAWSGQMGTHSAVHTGYEEGMVLRSWRPGGLPESRECYPGRPGVGTAPGALDSISPSLPVRLLPGPGKQCTSGLLWDITGSPSPSILLGALPVGPQRPAATLPSIPGRQKWPLLAPSPAPSHNARPDVEAACGGPGGAARVVWAVGGPATGEGVSDEGLRCPCLVCWGAGGWGGAAGFQVPSVSWNRKGWFPSNRHLLWRQAPGRLTAPVPRTQPQVTA